MIDIRTLEGVRVDRIITDGGYFPVIQRIGPKSAVLVLRTRAGHGGVEGRLEVMRTDDNGMTWSDSVVAADSERDDRNPALEVVGQEVIVAYYHHARYDADQVYHPDEPVDTMVTRSPDGVVTWDQPTFVTDGPLNGASPYGKIVALNDGTLLMDLYSVDETNIFEEEEEDPTIYKSYVIRTKDGGRTWGDESLIAEGHNECAMWVLDNGEILAVPRHQRPGFGGASVWITRNRWRL